MSFTVGFGKQFLIEWKQYKPDQKTAVTQFVSLVQSYGLDQTKLPGKLSPSWLNAGQANHAYAIQYSLWHYHVGLPSYKVNGPGRPMTSDWVVHFQWLSGTTHIDVVDMYTHYLQSGNFYLPPVGNLTTPAAPPVPPAAPQGADSAAE